MKVKWLGHSCFLLTSGSGLKIILDPYSSVQGVNYAPIKESADIVTSSHEHFDHNAVSSVGGKPEVIKTSGMHTSKGIPFKGISSFHDESDGKQRGSNIIFCFTLDGLRVCHLGDLGHELSKEQLKDINEVDLLLIPVGGYFTIDAHVATRIFNTMKPKVTIPMHFKTPKLNFPIAGVEDFITGKNTVKKLDSSELELASGNLPPIPEIIVLKPAL